MTVNTYDSIRPKSIGEGEGGGWGRNSSMIIEIDFNSKTDGPLLSQSLKVKEKLFLFSAYFQDMGSL